MVIPSSLAQECLLFSLSSETTSLFRLGIARSGSSDQEEVCCGLGFPKQEKLKPTKTLRVSSSPVNFLRVSAAPSGSKHCTWWWNFEAPNGSHSVHPALKPSKIYKQDKTTRVAPKNLVQGKKHSAWFVSSPKSEGFHGIFLKGF